MDEARPFLERLKRRKLVQWAAAYLAGAWLLLQVIDVLASLFSWPTLVGRGAAVVLGVGFLGALIVAWFHGERGEQRVRTVELLMLAAVCVLAGAAVSFVGGGGQATGAGRPAVPALSAAPVAEQGSIAVLPFENLSSDREQEYFSDGLTEELLTALSQLPELRVAARTSAFSFKGRNVPVDSIARALHVARVVEGSVRKSGDRVRITAQLVDPASGYQVWSQTYDRKLQDVFAIQDEIAHAIVQKLEIQLRAGQEQGQLAREQTRDPEAHTLELRGMYFVRRLDRSDVAHGVELLQQAVRRDPQYARAHAELSRAYSYQAYAGYGEREPLMHAAREEARRAVTLDSTLAEAHLSLGGLALREDWNFAVAEAEWRKAVQLNPGLAQARAQLAWLLVISGRSAEAIALAQRAAELDPISGAILNDAAGVYNYAHQPQRALESFLAAVQLQPDNKTIFANMALTYGAMGRNEEAIRAAEQALDSSRFSLAVLAFVYGRAGRRADAEKALGALQGLPHPGTYLLATAYAGLGDRERVFAYLERAVAEKDPPATDLAVDPAFDPYRGDPRMQRLVERLGFH